MQKMGEAHKGLFEHAQQGLAGNARTAQRKAAEPTRQYQRKQQRQEFKKPEKARFKCKVWFVDGNSTVMFSYDSKKSIGGTIIIDEYEGYVKLLRQLNEWHQAKRIRTAMMWANLDKDPLTSTANYDYEIIKLTKNDTINKEINFLRVEANSILDYPKILASQANKFHQSKIA